ncbi:MULTISPECIES: hypothetical protein [unclassified Lysobacter]|uniref:hypothetical protein n=1 Tax=unclassified Lysobacter TaxID=2635362 RepID=UPI001BE82FC1|nr:MULTISPECIES: hypothetical protein [unclassified Lysobacter]MBT2746135.1 hypothetical protein [Lysobacter sp. ISL-42]MBT2752570.1 hypothetical protein [Lysobacter sp. ISL-50]MBT2776701.1 hypothetical protein [Lysobacter sp. ISL-54]MBT2780731.1 hypothetical protein [Lysobacter sp. ISL-52]
MNRTPENTAADAVRFDDPRIAREWELQERAQREERAGAPMDEADPRLAQYRLLTRALRAPVMEPIAYGFAEQIARRAQALAAGNDRVERYLQQLLLAALVVAGAAMVWSSSANWWPALQAQVPSGSLSWGVLAGGCCLLTWGWEGVARAIGLDAAPRHTA